VENVSFIGVARDWEVEAFASFYRVLYLERIRQKGEDKLWWISSKRGYLLLNPSTMSWVVMMVSISLGKVF
jgi:Zn-dependent peptidase ImmA (M78 family)